ncbi:MAG TPA: tetratricopeptide repeat protein, partial [Pricia sp.]|nr:tetratricopeptide repeat protein [Pricia sp.]
MQSQIDNNAVSPRTCYPHNAQRVISILFCLVFLGGHAQSIPNAFQGSVDSLVQARPAGFAQIHGVLGKNRNDTLLMRYVANTSARNNYAAGQAYALNELGRSYRNTSQYDRSIVLHREALGVSEKADNLDFRIYSLNNLGVVYRRISSIRMAMDSHQRALALAQNVKSPSNSLQRSINVSLNGIGNLYLMLNQYDRAISYFERSLQLEAELGNVLGLAINNQNIGKCLEALGKLDEALDRYRISLAYNEQ